MHVTRRDLALAGALALSVPSLFVGAPALAEAGDEAAVKQNVEALREALLKADKAQLERLTAEQLSYGHSDGRVQNKAEFIDGVMTRKATVKSLKFPDLKIAVAGDAAIARHLYRIRKRNRRQAQQHQDRHSRGLAKRRRKLEAPGASGLQIGLSVNQAASILGLNI